jgi:hypothetical protein
MLSAQETLHSAYYRSGKTSQFMSVFLYVVHSNFLHYGALSASMDLQQLRLC